MLAPSACLRHAAGPLAGAAVRRPDWRPSLAPPPLRRRRHGLALARRPAPLFVHASAAGPAEQPDAAEESRLLAIAAAAGGKLNKTAVGKLAVAELRQECQSLGLPSDGLKPDLVGRLMAWWEERGQQALQRRQQEQPAEAAAEQGNEEAVAGVQLAAGPEEEAGPVEAVEAAAAPVQQAAAPVQAGPAPPQRQPPRQQQHRDQREQQQQRAVQAEGQGEVTVTWLGTSSGSPTTRRNVSSIAVRFDERLYLVDCGEGTRNQLRHIEADFAQLRAIFITHMHGDHCFGTAGVVAAVNEARRGTPLQNDPLVVFGPPELQSTVLAGVRAGAIKLTTPLVVTGFVLDPAKAQPPRPVDDSGMLQFALQAPDQAARLPPALAASWQATYDRGSEKVVQMGLTWTVRIPGGPVVGAAQLQHRVPCWGYVFQEANTTVEAPGAAAGAADAVAGAAPTAAATAAAAAEQAEGSAEQAEGSDASSSRPAGQQGAAGEPWVRRGRKLVILGDTCDSSAIGPLAVGCDLLSHEATFCSGMEDKAAVAQHSTTLQAGAFAAEVGARRLVLTHFSARYDGGPRPPRHRHQGGFRQRSGGRSEGGGGEDLKQSELSRLLEETYSTYRRDSLYLADDFFCFDVPQHKPMPLAQVQAKQAQQAQRAAELRERKPSRQCQGRPQGQWQGQGQGQGQGRQQQWGNGRQGGGQRQQYQQRREGGWEGGREGGNGRQQQYGDRRPGNGGQQYGGQQYRQQGGRQQYQGQQQRQRSASGAAPGRDE